MTDHGPAAKIWTSVATWVSIASLGLLLLSSATTPFSTLGSLSCLPFRCSSWSAVDTTARISRETGVKMCPGGLEEGSTRCGGTNTEAVSTLGKIACGWRWERT
ncbi:hypothetical protein L227DRAFT_203519 [Lentinus tigrinus ALCF2SS1-6]|uniref:Uncharacterized protein n=1 Tax=Lentinus tigrinus ALCF2SS1-6 TaxID=1328759 RepID=A0A5C2SPZ3_9APHY|nr:hypothetical protein L227DRAFT_203519 [Lentinus tigrinus ALCF2SS1-6]